MIRLYALFCFCRHRLYFHLGIRMFSFFSSIHSTLKARQYKLPVSIKNIQGGYSIIVLLLCSTIRHRVRRQSSKISKFNYYRAEDWKNTWSARETEPCLARVFFMSVLQACFHSQIMGSNGVFLHLAFSLKKPAHFHLLLAHPSQSAAYSSWGFVFSQISTGPPPILQASSSPPRSHRRFDLASSTFSQILLSFAHIFKRRSSGVCVLIPGSKQGNPCPT
jgi:hypothetical protein